MKKLDRFVLKAFIGPFFAILLVVLFVLMMQFLWLYIDELVGKGLRLLVILEFMMWGCCTILPMALPLATLLASMMTVGQMAENYELLAIRASGTSFGRLIVPIIVSSFLISIGAFFAGNDLVPKAFNEIYTLRDDIGRTKNEIKIPSGTFYDGIDGYILRIQEQTDDKMMLGVMVYDHTGGKGNTAVTLADSAKLTMSDTKDYLTFTLYNGANYQETNSKQYRDTTMQLQRINFDRQELIIPLNNYSFEKSDSNRFGDQIKTMSTGQLSYLRDSLRIKISESHDQHYKSAMMNQYLLMHQQLDTAHHADSRALFKADGYMKWGTYSELATAYMEASNTANQMMSDISVFNGDVYECNFFLSRADIEFLKKFAQALACFILFFIGAPLGALIKKGGLGVSAIVSVLFFVLYWVVDISGSKLARDGAIDATTGAFISAYVLAPIGGYLMWKAVHDDELFNLDSIKNWWRMIKSKVMSFIHPTRIVYMGTPEFAVAPLDNLVRKGYKVVGVVTVADKPSGRGLKMNESAVKQYAVAHDIPVLQPVKLKDPEFLEQLRSWKADMFVVVAFRMLPEEVWTMPKLGTFNLHAALLPQYRGAAPINWAVINGEKMTGVTTFMIDHDIDTGGIILRQEYRIAPDETVGEVHDKLMEIGTTLVEQTVEGLIQHNVDTRVQRSFIMGSEVLKKAPKLTRELCHIDWRDTTDNIYNLIRGLSPYPAAFTEIQRDGEQNPLQLKIFGAEKTELKGKPGEVLSDGKSYLAVATLDGAISIKDLQLAGKKRMDVKSFLLGFREPCSYVCTEGTSRSEIEKTRA